MSHCYSDDSCSSGSDDECHEKVRRRRGVRNKGGGPQPNGCCSPQPFYSIPPNYPPPQGFQPPVFAPPPQFGTASMGPYYGADPNYIGQPGFTSAPGIVPPPPGFLPNLPPSQDYTQTPPNQSLYASQIYSPQPYQTQQFYASRTSVPNPNDRYNYNPPTNIPQKRPFWDNDYSTTHCTKCKQAFTIFRRKHHCRKCGHIFCWECSTENKAIPELGYYFPVKVCDDCWMEMDRKKNETNYESYSTS